MNSGLLLWNITRMRQMELQKRKEQGTADKSDLSRMDFVPYTTHMMRTRTKVNTTLAQTRGSAIRGTFSFLFWGREGSFFQHLCF
jgi:hypothetical protein